jgi:hypothetical protein
MNQSGIDFSSKGDKRNSKEPCSNHDKGGGALLMPYATIIDRCAW